MEEILYADSDILVAVKPAGIESQAARRFEPDMVSRLKRYLVVNKLCTPGKEPYIGVIHRLDKPVSGIMVYGRTKNAAARPSDGFNRRRLRMGPPFLRPEGQSCPASGFHTAFVSCLRLGSACGCCSGQPP